MPKLHTTLEPGDVLLIPAGSGASITFVEKSGRRSRVIVESNAPVTVTRASEGKSQHSPERLVPRRPMPKRA
ncbi:hypothetical protein D3C81_1414640 [compost metagenome]